MFRQPTYIPKKKYSLRYINKNKCKDIQNIVLMYDFYRVQMKKKKNMNANRIAKLTKKTYQERVKQANFHSGYEYEQEFMPGINFYKFLAKRSGAFIDNKFDKL